MIQRVFRLKANHPSRTVSRFSRSLPAVLLLAALMLSGLGAGCSSEDVAYADMPAKPKLLVVLSFDQMRGDYLERWAGHWSERGFKRLLQGGKYYPNAAFKHANTSTGPGHAIISTGTYPHKNGIVQNTFYDKRLRRATYAVEDAASAVHGVEPIANGRAALKGRSPRNLQMPTLGDWMKQRLPGSKSVAVSSKDRAAICMAGHNADAVVWLDEKTPAFTTSVYYDSTAPSWVSSVDITAWMRSYSKHQWNPFLDEAAYTTADSMPGEGQFSGGGSSFPHVLPEFDPADPKPFVRAINVTPYAAELTFEMAKAAVREHQLGADTIPDILNVGISSTDYAGHLFGPDSRELLDIYLKCDTLLGEYLEFLDETVGRHSYVIALSSDHGVGTIPETAESQGKRAGRVDELDLADRIDLYLTETFPTRGSVNWLAAAEFPNVFLDVRAVDSARAPRAEIVDSLCGFLMRQEEVALAFSGKKLQEGTVGIQSELVDLAAMSAYPDRTGDVIVYLPPHFLYGSTPASHGTPYAYDREVPLLFYGWRVEHDHDSGDASPVDIAPSLANLIDLELVNVDGRALPLEVPLK